MAFIKCVLFGHEKSKLKESVFGNRESFYGYNFFGKYTAYHYIKITKIYRCNHCGVDYSIVTKAIDSDNEWDTYYQKIISSYQDRLDKVYKEIEEFKKDPLNKSLPFKPVPLFSSPFMDEDINNYYLYEGNPFFMLKRKTNQLDDILNKYKASLYKKSKAKGK